ncbi:winged helix-turn-helix transcriptional regulator [Pararobbsia alpina]|uniref:HTH hxlR-type domain-containing protein n=1 Tax=Pararobbsia alpina TaxID=621374 RepID=A0A6S7D1N9_9BURK|nr:helix-turn-helix domain-containing protein [Pararobbsia alpina]CAB3803666.1 hypothetical protein LMG28138_05391 [Pararobbsia alpina]
MKPSHFNLPPGACQEAAAVLERIADKWSVFVIVSLSDGSLRFNELKRSVEGVSQKVLTSTLRNLERDGFITRTVTPTVPPRVDYELTALGRDVLVPLDALADWAIARRTVVAEARAAFDRHQLVQTQAGSAVAVPSRHSVSPESDVSRVSDSNLSGLPLGSEALPVYET